MSSVLTLRAGPAALRLLRERGLRAADVDCIPAASGGAKWLGIAGLDRYLFGQFLQAPRARPLPLIGSSIGSWRMACLAQRDPLAALARGHTAYIHHQRYSPKPDAAEVSDVLARALDLLLGAQGVQEILAHPTFRLHVITAEGRGLASRRHRVPLSAALTSAALANVVARRSLRWHFRRTVFHAGQDSAFTHLRDLPTVHRPLTAGNLQGALLASGSIPLLMEGVTIPEAPGMHWDGGVTDYHLDLDFGAGDGLVLYPHFYGHLVPGWFDKGLPWRRARATETRLSRVLLLAPSPRFVAGLPGGKIPDRRDFYTLSERERIRRWEAIAAASEVLGEALHELIATNRLADAVRPWDAPEEAP